MQKAEPLASEGTTVPNVTPAAREAESEDLPSVLPYMPSPPTHEPSSATKAPEIVILEQQECTNDNDAQSNTWETTPTPKFAFAFGSKTGNTKPAFDFGVPTNLKLNSAEKLPPGNVQVDKIRFEVDDRILNKQKSTEQASRIPLQEKAAKSLNVTLSNSRPRTPTYEFGSADPKLSPAFEFKAQDRPRKLWEIDDSTAPPELHFDDKSSQENASATITVSKQSSNRTEDAGFQLHPPTAIPDHANDTPEPPTTPPRQESYGYANITPDSTRYTTYLPVRRQYGLLTPPETPEMLLRSLSKPMNDSGYFSGERRREPVTPQSPLPRVSRKPVPITSRPMLDDTEVAKTYDTGIEDGAVQGVEDLPAEQGERGGCFARFSFKRLKEKAKGKVRR